MCLIHQWIYENGREGMRTCAKCGKHQSFETGGEGNWGPIAFVNIDENQYQWKKTYQEFQERANRAKSKQERHKIWKEQENWLDRTRPKERDKDE